jgi:hypothetical protein
VSAINHLNEHEAAAVRREAVACAESLLHRTASFLPAVRRLAAIRFQLREFESDSDLLLFTAIDSESDHIPAEAARQHCASSWLKECDAEVAQLEVFFAEQVSAACRSIIERFAHAV